MTTIFQAFILGCAMCFPGTTLGITPINTLSDGRSFSCNSKGILMCLNNPYTGINTWTYENGTILSECVFSTCNDYDSSYTYSSDTTNGVFNLTIDEVEYKHHGTVFYCSNGSGNTNFTVNVKECGSSSENECQWNIEVLYTCVVTWAAMTGIYLFMNCHMLIYIKRIVEATGIMLDVCVISLAVSVVPGLGIIGILYIFWRLDIKDKKSIFLLAVLSGCPVLGICFIFSRVTFLERKQREPISCFCVAMFCIGCLISLALGIILILTTRICDISDFFRGFRGLQTSISYLALLACLYVFVTTMLLIIETRYFACHGKPQFSCGQCKQTFDLMSMEGYCLTCRKTLCNECGREEVRSNHVVWRKHPKQCKTHEENENTAIFREDCYCFDETYKCLKCQGNQEINQDSKPCQLHTYIHGTRAAVALSTVYCRICSVELCGSCYVLHHNATQFWLHNISDVMHASYNGAGENKNTDIRCTSCNAKAKIFCLDSSLHLCLCCYLKHFEFGLFYKQHVRRNTHPNLSLCFDTRSTNHLHSSEKISQFCCDCCLTKKSMISANVYCIGCKIYMCQRCFIVHCKISNNWPETKHAKLLEVYVLGTPNISEDFYTKKCTNKEEYCCAKLKNPTDAFMFCRIDDMYICEECSTKHKPNSTIWIKKCQRCLTGEETETSYCTVCKLYMCRRCDKIHHLFVYRFLRLYNINDTNSCHGCSMIGDGKEAYVYCRKCESYLCQQCFGLHRKFKGLEIPRTCIVLKSFPVIGTLVILLDSCCCCTESKVKPASDELQSSAEKTKLNQTREGHNTRPLSRESYEIASDGSVKIDI